MTNLSNYALFKIDLEIVADFGVTLEHSLQVSPYLSIVFYRIWTDLYVWNRMTCWKREVIRCILCLWERERESVCVSVFVLEKERRVCLWVCCCLNFYLCQSQLRNLSITAACMISSDVFIALCVNQKSQKGSLKQCAHGYSFICFLFLCVQYWTQWLLILWLLCRTHVANYIQQCS